MNEVLINEICYFIIVKCKSMNAGSFEYLSKMIIDDVERIKEKLNNELFCDCLNPSFYANDKTKCWVCGKDIKKTA